MVRNRLLFIVWLYWGVNLIYAQDFEHMFDAYLQPAPEVLDINFLKSYPKFRTIHHDTFYRRDTVSNILYAYKEFRTNRLRGKILLDSVGTRTLSYSGVIPKSQRLVETIDTKRSDYGIQIRRLTEATIALRVQDVNNLYSITFNDKNTCVTLIRNGHAKKIASFVGDKTRIVYLYLHEGMLYIYYSYRFIGKCRLEEFENSTTCGFMIYGQKKYCIDEFVVNYLDDYHDNKMDAFIESGLINERQFGRWETEKGLITASKKHTHHSKYSLRFQLDYYTDWDNHKVANSRRTEICPKAINPQPLDSWICSFDIYFPGKEDGDEYYVSDENSELFWQSHDRGAAKGLSPHVALYLKKDIISFQTLSREELRSDKKGIRSNKDFKQDGKIAKNSDEITDNSIIQELKKGIWHNFTIYIKEGYTDAQLPRSIVYIDGKKVLDWNHVNAYNCESLPEYLKLGIYKWPWAKKTINSEVKKRVLYFDNILYLR